MTINPKYRILLVEDEALIVLGIEDALERLGCEVVGPASTVGRALELLRHGAVVDGAILDVTVRDGSTYSLAARLRARGIPFVFESGQSDWVFPMEWRHYPCLAKPFTSGALHGHLRGLLTEIGKRDRSNEGNVIAR
jgi:CheY-like chemotaxis protein